MEAAAQRAASQVVLGRAGLGMDKMASMSIVRRETTAGMTALEDIPPRALSVALVGRVRNPTATVDSVVVAAAAGVAQVQVAVTAGGTRAAICGAKLGTVAAAAALTRAGRQRLRPVEEQLARLERRGLYQVCMGTSRLSSSPPRPHP